MSKRRRRIRRENRLKLSPRQRKAEYRAIQRYERNHAGEFRMIDWLDGPPQGERFIHPVILSLPSVYGDDR